MSCMVVAYRSSLSLSPPCRTCIQIQHTQTQRKTDTEYIAKHEHEQEWMDVDLLSGGFWGWNREMGLEFGNENHVKMKVKLLSVVVGCWLCNWTKAKKEREHEEKKQYTHNTTHSTNKTKVCWFRVWILTFDFNYVCMYVPLFLSFLLVFNTTIHFILHHFILQILVLVCYYCFFHFKELLDY